MDSVHRVLGKLGHIRYHRYLLGKFSKYNERAYEIDSPNTYKSTMAIEGNGYLNVLLYKASGKLVVQRLSDWDAATNKEAIYTGTRETSSNIQYMDANGRWYMIFYGAGSIVIK